MSETWTGLWQRAQEQAGRQGPYWILTVGGKEFFFFEGEAPKRFKKGDLVKVTYQTKQRKNGDGEMLIAKKIEHERLPAAAIEPCADIKSIRIEAAKIASSILKHNPEDYEGFRALVGSIVAYVTSGKWEEDQKEDIPIEEEEEDVPF